MSRNIKLVFVWDWENPWYQMMTWKDGLAKSIQILSKEWDVKVYSIGSDTIFQHDYFPIYLKPTSEELAETILRDRPDVILVWGDLTRPTIPHLTNKGIPMALCLAGGTFRDYVDCFDLIFVESKSYLDKMKAEGINVIQAFGTNTELFKPIKQEKVWDAIFPATFANWKRHKLFAEALRDKGLACGWMYKDHETECYEVCQRSGTLVLPHTPADVLTYLYNASRTCVITSNSQGGSQRTVLEAMACNIPVMVMADSDKTTEYVQVSGYGEIVLPEVEDIKEAVEKWKNKKVNSREWILKNYSEQVYANKLKEGILSIC